MKLRQIIIGGLVSLAATVGCDNQANSNKNTQNFQKVEYKILGNGRLLVDLCCEDDYKHEIYKVDLGQKIGSYSIIIPIGKEAKVYYGKEMGLFYFSGNNNKEMFRNWDNVGYANTMDPWKTQLFKEIRQKYFQKEFAGEAGQF